MLFAFAYSVLRLLLDLVDVPRGKSQSDHGRRFLIGGSAILG